MFFLRNIKFSRDPSEHTFFFIFFDLLVIKILYLGREPK